MKNAYTTLELRLELRSPTAGKGTFYKASDFFFLLLIE